jgi:iron complex outermembrane receptor protein
MNPKNRFRSINPRILAAVALALAPDPARSAEPARPFDIRAQSLSAALQAYSEQSGLVVTAPPDLLKGRAAAQVSGEMTPEAALNRLLERSGLSMRRTAGGGIVIVETDRPAPQASAPPASAPIAVAQAVDAGAENLEEVTVTGKIIFTQNDAFGATKMGIAIEDTPQTVNIVTADLMAVAGMKTFMDFYKVDASSGTSHVVDGYPRSYFRGFREQGNLAGNNAMRVDGFRMSGNIDLDLALFDRFEVVKGATSSLYGQNNVGGLLNAVSKLPQSRAGAQFALEGGQFDDYRGEVDLTGPLFGSEAWSFRLIGAYGDSGSYVDYMGLDRKLVSPSVSFTPNDSTRFVFRATFQQDDNRYHWAPVLQLAGAGDDPVLDRVLSEGLRFADVPRSRFFAMPWNGDSREARVLQAQADHEFANGWTLRAHGQGSKLEQSTHNFYAQGPFDENGFAYFTSAYGTEAETKLYAGEVDLFGDVELFGREHTLFFGVDYTKVSNALRLAFGGLSFGYEGSAFNALEPDYGAVPPMTDVNDDFAYVYDSDDETALFGATVQLIAHATDRLDVLVGGRQTKDRFVNRSRGGALSGSEVDALSFSRVDTEFSKFVGQGGLSYEVRDGLHLYASYGETFIGQFGDIYVDEGGVPGRRQLGPEEGTSKEIGVKGEITPELIYTAALFDMERTNISEGDPEHPGFRLNVGTQRSRGLELGLQGKVLPQLSVNASLAWLDAEFVEGEATGGRPPNAPKFGLSLYGTYEVLGGALKGLGYGLGVVHKRGFEGFDYGWTADVGRPVTFDFGDFTEVDARVFYGIGRWSYSLSATNLLDERYYAQDRASLSLGTHVNPPRAIRARVEYRF